MLTEVPVTPATRVVDVVEYCKEAGEGECHLAEVWNGHGESNHWFTRNRQESYFSHPCFHLYAKQNVYGTCLICLDFRQFPLLVSKKLNPSLRSLEI